MLKLSEITRLIPVKNIVDLVGAVGIEIASLTSKSFMGIPMKPIGIPN
jgi:hypothetical protein